ncbi:MAG: sulfatase-like hydrolase/transferase, partial [Gammaproteobacteria bacterium]|nr:sulfatase-like hydrolase/transferase [Gammaproteobacteria bacterium]
IDEKMMADYLRPLGYRTAVIGKTHSFKNRSTMAELGIDMTSELARTARSGGFEPYEHHEGLYPDPVLPEKQGYSDYLRSLGYDAVNPWDRCANSGIDIDGKLYSGWNLSSSKYPAAIEEAHSETAFCTQRAMDFMDETGEKSWCLHLSYIKPHWPLIAAAPYHELFCAEDLQTVVRSDRERENAHPVYQAFMQQEYSQSFARDDVRELVVPVYMGLIKQVDDHLGRLFDYMQTRNLFENTMVVFTADHGDYLGDHWLGEKDLFHDVSAKLPMIVVDPRSEADSSRGSQCEAFVESVDILPSFIEFAGGEICKERLEGRSLTTLLHHSGNESWRDYTISEIDYSDRGSRSLLGLEPYQCRGIMVRNQRWKYIYHQQFVPQLFDMENDPDELIDLGTDRQYRNICSDMKGLAFQWRDSLKRRTGMSYSDLEKLGPETDESHGIIIGRW